MHGALHLHAFRRSRIASIAASFGPDLGKKTYPNCARCSCDLQPHKSEPWPGLVGVDEGERHGESTPISDIAAVLTVER